MAYSYSALQQYKGCPASYKFSRIDKLPSPTGPAAERGKMLHSEIEEVVKGGLAMLSEPIAHLLPKLEELRAKGAEPEKEFAVDSEWKPVEFTDPKAMFRGVIDLYLKIDNMVDLRDWKSGKVRDYSTQLKAYAPAIFALDSEVTVIKPSIEFIDLKKHTTYEFISRDAEEELRRNIVDQIDAIENDKIFVANPSMGCKWCHYRKSNGGPCSW